ncbi:porin [Paraburkholderia sediminicola]|uniref:porin n=1 Tax=Paraburkholderia sediminicola TaxID=458836 RepID=UPI0038B81D0B
MKKLLLTVAFLTAFPISTFAQSSVTLFGIVDAGITYTNNSAGKSLVQAQSGIAQANRWGLRVIEDIGGGTKVIATLENGFNGFTGKLGQGGLEFGRQSFVGVTNPTWGTLTLGRQYDPVVDMVQTTTFNGHAGPFFAHPSDIDNTDNAFRVNNAVKYVTPTWNGLTAEGMYAFGGLAGNFRGNSTIAAALSYVNGPLYLAAGYFYALNPAQQFPDGNFQPNGTPGVSNGEGTFGYVGNPRNMQTISAGGTYTLGALQLALNYSTVRFDNADGIVGNTVSFDSYEAWALYYITPLASVGGGYTFTEGKVDFNDARPKYNQFNLFIDYALSKRTDVYLMGVYQKASGGANADIYQGIVGQQSSTTGQVVARIGMRHKF